MRWLVSPAALCTVLFVGYTESAHAADSDAMVTKAPVLTKAPPSVPPPAPCASLQGFLLTDCQLNYFGIRFYGTIDVGYGYQTHGAPWDPNFTPGASYLLQKMNRGAIWTLAPNGLSQSNLGFQIKEPLGLGWSLVGQLEGGFDPYSLQYANSPHSEFNNIGVPVNQQTTNGDSSRAGQYYNSQGFVGLSSDTYGTLTVLRQNALTLDGVIAYDPMAASYAFSPLGFQGGFAGGGDTEQSKYSTAVKYRLNIGNYRLAALGQFGGYEQNNASRGAWEGQAGGDFRVGPGILSLDLFYDYVKDAVIMSLAGAPTNAQGVPTGTMLPQVLTATLSDNTAVMAAAKYKVDRLQLYAGYEWMQFAAPNDPFTIKGTGFTDIAGDNVCFGCNSGTGGTNINSTAFSASAGFKDKILQIAWGGAKYSITDSVDLVAAYYHYWQNNFAASAANVTKCATLPASGNNFCSGSVDAASAVIDWKFASKWDTYIGTMFSQFNGGLDNGFLSRNNLATTAGLRFRF
jgi:predicted porin